ncbi:class I SAM-dependent methyltransferase [Emticicia sp. SJ17W-69]|uniref:class I SAM-dependent methyltransferase n=1 Tax=Emticicia sp. SJ17W-69 TaxID=3421657 RepID=UPI003EB94924
MFNILKKKYTTIPKDDFIKRLPSSLIGEGMLHEGNIFLFDLALRNMPSEGAVIEIGCYGGLSTNLICYFLRKYSLQNPFFGTDLWIYEGYHDEIGLETDWMDGRNDILRTDFMRHIKNSFINSTLLLSKDNLPNTCHLSSFDFFEKWLNNETIEDVFGRDAALGGSISFAYVDGNHAFEFVKKEFEYIDQFLIPKGFILFDDSRVDSKFGSAKFMKEMLQNVDYKLVMKNPNFLFQKK